MITFKIPITFTLSVTQVELARRAINLHYLGDSEANTLVDGKLVAKYPDKETDELREAHRRVGMVHQKYITVEVSESGSISIKGIE